MMQGYLKGQLNKEIVSATLIEKTITANGEYSPTSDGVDGYSNVTVNVPIPLNKLAQYVSGNLSTITSDDIYGATLIESNVFSYFTKLKSISFPDTITIIGNQAFYYSGLNTKVTIPNSVTNIGTNAFAYSGGIPSVEIGDGITNIATAAFDGCSGLRSITIRATTPPTLANANAFRGSTCNIYVPAESVDAYKAATNWSSLANRIFAIPE